MKKLFLTALGAAGLLAGCAADTGLNDSYTAASLWDTDNDGMFERAEFNTFGDNNFGMWDTDRNGFLDANEFGTGWTGAGWGNSVGAFDDFDDDDNGWLGSDEFFEDDDWVGLDDDRDGILDDNEWF